MNEVKEGKGKAKWDTFRIGAGGQENGGRGSKRKGGIGGERGRRKRKRERRKREREKG